VIAPLLYIWGDDELLAERLVTRFAAKIGEELGSPLERWDLRADPNSAATDAAQLYERLATPSMFGGGTLAVVANPGALVKRNDTRDRVVETIGLMAPGHALAVVEAARSNAKGPGIRRLADPIKAGGGTIASAMAPRPTALAAWITDEARDRGLALAGGAARELADRLGARVTEGDVDRRYLSRTASGELDKLELRHAIDEGPVTPEDVRELVAETTPASVWALSDAVGDRKAEVATATLDRLLDSTPEPVILAVLHRRIVELLEIGDRLSGGLNLPEAARAMGINSEFRARTLASQARAWNVRDLTAALEGLVTLDAMVKNVAGYEADTAQRRLAFLLWIRDRVTPRQHPSA
jgi:DNA polymerase-3 subunit delta